MNKAILSKINKAITLIEQQQRELEDIDCELGEGANGELDHITSSLCIIIDDLQEYLKNKSVGVEE